MRETSWWLIATGNGTIASAVRKVDRQVLDVGDAVPGGLVAPHDDVEDLLFLIGVAHGQTGQ